MELVPAATDNYDKKHLRRSGRKRARRACCSRWQVEDEKAS